MEKKYPKVEILPANFLITVPLGSTIKEALINSGLFFDFPCGGRGKCGKCRIKIIPVFEEPSEEELLLLEKNEILKGFRLACKTKIFGDCQIILPNSKRFGIDKNLMSPNKEIQLNPLIKKLFLRNASVENLTIVDNSKGLKIIDGINSYTLPQKLKEKFTNLISNSETDLTLVIQDKKVIEIEKNDTTNKIYGLAFDIGTTTIAGYLMNLGNNKVEEISYISDLNPQVAFGADVISRINSVIENKKNLKTLQKILLKKINDLISEATKELRVEAENIYALTIVGNTCMHHLFLGLNPSTLGYFPFSPMEKRALVKKASRFKIKINPEGRIFTLPNISGFVGSDTVSMILATNLHLSSEIKLAIDIGTNGEMVLGNKDKLIACSTAAGPAFEGANITCGMRATKGAIDKVWINDKVEFSVIGNGKPEGICGSGLLDLIATLLKIGIIDRNGRILSPEELNSMEAKKLLKNIIKLHNTNAFMVVEENLTTNGKPIILTQTDVRQLQLAKGAIAAGILALIDKYGITLENITEVYLAGAFGNYLNPVNACEIGLIPKNLLNRITSVGNAAGTGAKMALLSQFEYNETKKIAKSVNYFELSTYPQFNSLFIETLKFP